MKDARIILVFVVAILRVYSSGHQRADECPPLLSIPKSEWPQKVLDAMESGRRWGQCRDCGKVVTWADIGSGTSYTSEHGEITGFYCNKEN